jgi:hypothetical protein
MFGSALVVEFGSLECGSGSIFLLMRIRIRTPDLNNIQILGLVPNCTGKNTYIKKELLYWYKYRVYNFPKC